MAKPVINYKGYVTANPADRTGAKICIPQIVDRNQVQTLEQIVADAIDRGLIAGLKSSAAKSIANGTMIQLGEALNGGTGVIFGEFFAVRPYDHSDWPNKVGFKTVKTIEVDGVEQTIESNLFVATKAA